MEYIISLLIAFGIIASPEDLQQRQDKIEVKPGKIELDNPKKLEQAAEEAPSVIIIDDTEVA